MSDEKLQPTEKVYAIRPNKTALKKEHVKVQKLARELVNKTPQALSKLPLNDNLLLQIEVANQIKGGALKRQTKHIANLLLHLEDEAFEFLLDQENQLIQAAALETTHAIQYCDQLMKDGDDFLADLIKQHPQLDRQTLRNLMLQAKREKQTAKSNKSQQKLANYIKQHLKP